jgi:hypothetical protein
MRSKPFAIAAFAVVLTAGIISLAQGQNNGGTGTAKAPSIRGTYMLVSRDLAGGGTLKPPSIVGMMTYTEKYRNFNVAWSDSAGKHTSISYVAEYSLSDKEYTEKSLYYCINDEITGGGLKYDFGNASGTAPVTIDGAQIKAKFPLNNEPEVVFEGSKLTATRAGAFVDHWEKVR